MVVHGLLIRGGILPTLRVNIHFLLEHIDHCYMTRLSSVLIALSLHFSHASNTYSFTCVFPDIFDIWNTIPSCTRKTSKYNEFSRIDNTMKSGKLL